MVDTKIWAIPRNNRYQEMVDTKIWAIPRNNLYQEMGDTKFSLKMWDTKRMAILIYCTVHYTVREGDQKALKVTGNGLKKPPGTVANEFKKSL